jgi:2TM domain
MYPDNDYLQTATQMQRWRDFSSNVFAYVVVNILLTTIWAVQGKGFFWPLYSLLGWGIGLSAQHFGVVIRGQITDKDVRQKLGTQRQESQSFPLPQVGYQIRVKGYLDDERSMWFDGLTVIHEGQDETILAGPIADQAALHGVLRKVRDLGLSLEAVSRH